jgi:hypothetical protein
MEEAEDDMLRSPDSKRLNVSAKPPKKSFIIQTKPVIAQTSGRKSGRDHSNKVSPQAKMDGLMRSTFTSMNRVQKLFDQVELISVEENPDLHTTEEQNKEDSSDEDAEIRDLISQKSRLMTQQRQRISYMKAPKVDSVENDHPYINQNSGVSESSKRAISLANVKHDNPFPNTT